MGSVEDYNLDNDRGFSCHKKAQKVQKYFTRVSRIDADYRLDFILAVLPNFALAKLPRGRQF